VVKVKEGLLSGKVCPLPTQDIVLNLKNRNNAFKNFGYGAPNPDEPNEAFWLKKAKMYNAPTDVVKTMLCGNCAAFIQTPKMMECIKGGLEKGKDSENELDYDQQFIDAADLGFCELFHFTCAAARTCDAWKSGGSIKKD
jgi:hypothetical protein